MVDIFQWSQDIFVITNKKSMTGNVFPIEEQSASLPFYIQFYFYNKRNNLHFYRTQF